jgi:hypothetical protein
MQGGTHRDSLKTLELFHWKDKCNRLLYSRYCTWVPVDCMKDPFGWMKSKKELLEKFLPKLKSYNFLKARLRI